MALMKHLVPHRALFMATLFASAVHAGEAPISSRDSWVREPAPGAGNAAAFLTLHNNSSNPQQLTGVRCATEIARNCELHQHIHSEGRMRMQKIEGGLTLPANSDLRFSPGSYHVMLLDITPALKAGATVELVFTFADQSTYHAQLPVKSVHEE